MLFQLINETRKNLAPDDYALLQKRMTDFYSDMPDGVRIVADFSTMQRDKNFSVIEVESRKQLDQLMAPFTDYVDIDVYEVQPAFAPQPE